MNIIYAKKFSFPNESANALQGLNMLAAFSACSDRVYSFLSYAKNFNSHDEFIRTIQASGVEEFGTYTVASNTLRGVRYSLWLAGRVLSADKRTLIYTRENSTACQALRFKFLHVPPLPVFHEVHKFDINITDSSVAARREQKKLKRFLSQLQGVVFIDEVLREQAYEYLDLKVPSHVAPSGANISIFDRCPVVSSEPTILLGYFGKINAEKGSLLLAKAMRFLPEQYRIRFVGDVSEKDKQLLLNAADEAAHRVELRSRVAPTSLAKAMQDVHISVIPSILEGHFLSPLKLAESLAMGLPLVCMPLPHLKRVLQEGKHALFAEDTTPEALAKAIQTLGDSPALMENMQRENRAYAQQFSWEKRARGIVEFMEEVIQKKQAH